MRIPVLCLTIVLLLAAPLLATPYWTPADAERARAAAVDRERAKIPSQFSRATPAEYLNDYEAAAWFVASMQVTDPLSPDYGGIREGEHLPDIIQTDNTSESIWIFSRYYELTGDSAILPHLDASWVYVLNHPAYDEEGGYFPQTGYYRYYNCGWAVRAGMKYEQVFSDLTYKVYVDSCANYLATHTLTREGTTTLHFLVNPPVLAWGAGNLRKYGVVNANSFWMEKGVNKGQRVKGWVEADSLVLGNEEWAMSGGAVMWGVLESYFDEYPGEEAAWVATYVAQMDTVADPGDWENAWQGWYALGEKRLEQVVYPLEGFPKLDIVTSGPLPPNPPELFGKASFLRLLEQARQAYDWVLIDSPPVISVTDAVVCSNLVDMVLVVIEFGRLERKVIQGALRQLGRAGARVVGSVLNRVDLSKKHYYYDSHYYAYFYGYREDGETPGAEAEQSQSDVEPADGDRG